LFICTLLLLCEWFFFACTASMYYWLIWLCKFLHCNNCMSCMFLTCYTSYCLVTASRIYGIYICMYSPFVQKQVVAASMWCYLSPALSKGLICSHALIILLSISVRLCVVYHTILTCLSYVIATHITDYNTSWMAVGPQINTCMVGHQFHCGRSVLSQLSATVILIHFALPRTLTRSLERLKSPYKTYRFLHQLLTITV